eukprot:jgi/Tetstr1/425093/TSEL_015557.t1
MFLGPLLWFDVLPRARRLPEASTCVYLDPRQLSTIDGDVRRDFSSHPPTPTIIYIFQDNDIQWIKPSAVKPTLDLATVPVWDQSISTRDNAQAIKISLGSAGYLDTTKGKGSHQEQLILLAALRHATANYSMALAIADSINMDGPIY